MKAVKTEKTTEGEEEEEKEEEEEEEECEGGNIACDTVAHIRRWACRRP